VLQWCLLFFSTLPFYFDCTNFIPGIQIAKVLGCHVTTSCSTANIDLCKSLGADEVLDYKSADILEQLSKIGPTFDLAIDNVGTPANLYKQSHNFLVPTGKFVQIGLGVSLGSAQQLVGNLLIPAFLGGGKRKYEVLVVGRSSEDLAQLGAWMKEGKIRNVIDSTYEFDDAPNAFIRLKTGRAKGKIVVHVKKD
jgi:NADPH:quinone reductase-like Zn-dependent oxidoreductase